MARLVCSACGEKIIGQYIQALGKVWHPGCFHCAHCGEPITKSGFIEKRGKAYHPDCFHERFSPRCHACKQPIEGKYLRALGKLWHPEHFVCAHCGNPLPGNYYEYRGKPYCREDYLLLFREKCTLCGEPLEEQYMVDLWGNKYCKRHQEDPRCSSCERYIGLPGVEEGTTYDDGRLICLACSQTAIHELSAAYELLKGVQKVLAQYDFHFNRKLKIPIQLLGRDEMNSKLSKLRRRLNPAGITQTQIDKLFGAESARKINSLQVLYGLPLEHLGGVLAHELGHVWLFLNNYPALPEKLEEGVCELMAWYWLQNQESELAKIRSKLMEKNPNRIYGTGFRLVRKAVERSSLAYVLDHLKRHASLPKP